MATSDVFDALEIEQDRIAEMLRSLRGEEWSHPSACRGWSVGDVVLHLAQTEEGVAASLAGSDFGSLRGSVEASTIDELMAAWVDSERGMAPGELFARWDEARRRAVAGLRAADPERPVAWAAAPLKPRTLATTRLSEHWIHALDIADPLGLDFPDTDRLWHIARLAHRTIPYAFMRAGRSDPPTVRMELDAPDGETWTFGDEDAAIVIRGSASELCRVAARRLDRDDARSIVAQGPQADEVLELIRTYA